MNPALPITKYFFSGRVLCYVFFETFLLVPNLVPRGSRVGGGEYTLKKLKRRKEF
jgi:hypothetical protein